MDASTAARLATKGRRAHQTWSELFGGRALPARENRLSRTLSSPKNATGNHRSISRVSVTAAAAPSILACTPSIRTILPPAENP